MSPSPRIALATCSEFPQLDVDDQLLVPALAARGIEAVPQIWDEPFTDWWAFDLVVVRNTWDYVGRSEEFLTWARSIKQLVNPADVLAWSADKRYLIDLRDARIPIVPTIIVEPGERFPLIEAEVVVKPVESGGARDTERHDRDSARDAEILAQRIHASGRAALVQPYISGVEERGETALIYFGGEFSHAIHKGPLLTPGVPMVGGLFREEQIEAREPLPAERALGDRTIAYVTARFGPLAYARIDVLPALGAHLVLEVELVEPSLFIATSPGAPDRLAAAIAKPLP